MAEALDDTLVKCFVLTFEKAGQARLESAQQAIKDITPKPVWEFVYGFDKDDDVVDQAHDPRNNLFYYERSVSRAEIACYLGHQKIMRHFLETGSQYALVLEDDFQVLHPETLSDILTNIDRVMEGVDFLKLYNSSTSWKKQELSKRDFERFSVHTSRDPSTGMPGYVISRTGAKKMLSRDRVFRPIDHDLKYFWELDLKVGIINPDQIGERAGDLGGSFLRPNRRKMKGGQWRFVRSIRRRINKLYQRMNWNRTPS